MGLAAIADQVPTWSPSGRTIASPSDPSEVNGSRWWLDSGSTRSSGNPIFELNVLGTV